MFIDRGVFFDEHIARRHISFGLVIIVIRDEILDRILGKELAKFRIKLRCERLVRRHNQRWPAQARDHMRHGVSLTGAGHPEQGLIFEPVFDALDQFDDRLRLIARRLERLMQLIRAIGECDDQR